MQVYSLFIIWTAIITRDPRQRGTNDLSQKNMSALFI